MKQNYLKTLAVILLALTMSACASMHGTATVHPAANTTVVDNSSQLDKLVDQLQALPAEAVAQEELKAPDENTTPEPEPAFDLEPQPLSKHLSDRARIVMSDAEITCMAQVIYFEARGEGTTGQVGVGYVVLNRMGSDKFKPTSACGIVYERNRRGCQFSWVCDGKPETIRNWATYQRAKEVAISVMTRQARNPVGNSLYFRHKAAKSRYAKSQRLVASIGAHSFFAALQ